ncbi:hypothetical protein NITMOv2_3804 [Nitrospira moscoviensis]|uniref:Uncharacterized protein n=1 Tax=Nitrospira moscoviensis TaxID=42253 RepID=A0A0K2GH62_NITMO|nr:hypothetical protein NITMOv2_3804 [Nitrospira moscoviensis]
MTILQEPVEIFNTDALTYKLRSGKVLNSGREKRTLFRAKL